MPRFKQILNPYTAVMKKISRFIIAIVAFVSVSSCFEDMDDVFRPATTLEIQNFIYRAMNVWYLYKPDVPDLANGRFATQAELDKFLSNYVTPEDLYNQGLTAGFDRFSFITGDYRVLLDALAGITKSHGMEYGLVYYPNSEVNVFGYVQYVVPGSDAAGKGITRGVIFNTINGSQLTVNNYQMLSRQDSYTIGLATFDGIDITPTGQSVTLNKSVLTENPIHLAAVLQPEGQKIGYLMYNGFTSDFDNELNQAFGQFKSAGITDLVLDLRYNNGGAVRSATYLAGMITGQFTGQVFYTEHWNPEIQANFEQNNPEDLIGRFTDRFETGQIINSLNLSRVYVLTTHGTASASELVINGLDPYIEVIQVGSTTTGKFQASSTFYDSAPPRFGRQGASKRHHYAIQPLIYKSANAVGYTDFINGLPPDVEVYENLANLGELGDENEPLLAAALNQILSGRAQTALYKIKHREVGNSKKHLPIYQRMYAETDKNLNQ